MIKLFIVLFGISFLNGAIKNSTNIDIVDTVTSQYPEFSGVVVTVIVLYAIYKILKGRKK